MTTETTRRGILGGAGLAAVTLAVPALASSGSTGSGISPDLADLITAAADAMRISNDFDANTFAPTKARTMALVDRIPHVTVDIDGDPYWTTARPGAVNLARGAVERDPSRRHPDSAKLRSLVAADLRRQREATRIKRTTGLTAAFDRSNELSEAMADAEMAVARFPCETAADLHAKLAFMTERQMDDGMMLLDIVLADAARLANKEGR